MLEVDKLKVFLAAAETGSFSGAAHRLGLTQPTISGHIHTLEQKLRVNLFHRQGKRVSLTEEGTVLLPMARELVERANAFAEHARHPDHRIMNGTLRIGCETSLAKYVLPHLIGEFHQHFPQAHISCTKISHTSTEEKLASREIQFGVVARPINAPDLASWRLFSDELILVVGLHHPWSQRRIISPDELRETDLILTQEGASCLVNHEISPPETHSVLNLEDTEAALSAIQADQGVALVSRLAARGYLALNRVRHIHIHPTACLTFHVSLAYQSISCNGLARQFNEFIQSSTGRCVIARHTVGALRQ